MLNKNIAPPVFPLAVPFFLDHHTMRLSNGVEIVYLHDPAQEVFKTDITFEAGVYYQPRPLIASTAIQMLNEGTWQHPAEEIAGLFDYYGAYVDFNSGLQRSELNMISLNKYAPQTIGMLAEMVTSSTIPEKELEILLTNKRQEFLVNNEKTSHLARKKFAALLFGENHPYANQVDEKDFTQVTSSMIRDFYHQRINARHCRILVCGNAGEEVIQLMNKHFSPLTFPESPEEEPSYTFSPAPAGRYHVRKEKAVQTSLRIGKQGVQLTEEDYAGFMLLNTILGGYFGSRLMSNIREEKGYTYGIQSFNVSMPQNSYWCISTDINKEYTEATIEEVFKEIRRLQSIPVGEEELGLVKNYLHGDLLRELDGVFAQSDSLKHKLNYGLDNRIYADIIRRIKACTPETLMEMACKYWKTEDMYVVTAGE